MEQTINFSWKLLSFCVITAILCSGVAADAKFMMSSNYATWEQADFYCQRSRSTLAILDVPDLQRIFDNDIRPTPGEMLWVGRYLGYTDTVSMEGCYSNMTMFWRRSKVIPRNSLLNCLSFCNDTLHIGLQNELCYCLDSIPGRAAPLPSSSCRSQCPGEPSMNPQQYLTQCGRVDSNSVSIYRRVLKSDISLVDSLGECIAYNTRTRSWQPLDCTSQRIFTCDRKPCPIPIQQCMFLSQTATNWFDGRTNCERGGGYLATVNLTTSRFFDFRQSILDGVYWTGLHRKQAIVWKYSDNSNKDIFPSNKCVAVLKKPNGAWDWKLEDCDRRYKFVCLQEVISTTQAPRPPSTQRPTTQRPTTQTTQRTTPFPPFTTPTTGTTETPNAQPAVNDENDANAVTSFVYVNVISLFLCLYMFK